MSVSCPRCRRPLEVARAGGIEARACPQCHGVLLRQADLGHAVVEDAASAGLEVTAAEPPRPADGVGDDEPLECPDCGRRMEKFGYMGIGAIQIDGCATCAQVWIDAGELGKMKAAVASASERRDVRIADDRNTDFVKTIPPDSEEHVVIDVIDFLSGGPYPAYRRPWWFSLLLRWTGI